MTMNIQPHRLDARRSNFSVVRGNQTNYHYTNDFNSAFAQLRDASTMSAAFDSAERYPPPICLHGTRESVIAKIVETLSNPNGPRICWLRGMAGSGKSAIAQSIAEHFENQNPNILGASFFFSRGKAGQNNIKRFPPTIAYQLTISFPSLKSSIIAAIYRDPSILDKYPRRQFEQLIIEPTLKTTAHLPAFMVVVVDAIDECGDEKLMEDIISLITGRQSDALPIRFFFTSRPEPSICAKFTGPKICHVIALEEFNAQDDVGIFLRHRFDEICKREVMRHTSLPWPSRPDFERLVQRASGLFIFATTVMKFIDDKDDHPVRRLEMILKVEPIVASSAYAALDQLYTHILSTVPNTKSLQKVLGLIIALFDPLPVEGLQELLSLDRDDILLTLERLHSILLIPVDSGQPVEIFHESLRDFLTNAQRSNSYFIDLPIHHNDIAHHCLKLIAKDFRQGFCVIDQPELEFTWVLWYACDYWASHICRSPYSNDLIGDLIALETEALLYWIEALSMSHDLRCALRSVQDTSKWLIGAGPSLHLSGLLELLHEAEQFIIASLPHIKSGIRCWKVFRKKRERLSGKDDHCNCGYKLYISVTPKRRFLSAWKRFEKNITLSGPSPLQRLDAVVLSIPDENPPVVDTMGYVEDAVDFVVSWEYMVRHWGATMRSERRQSRTLLA